MSMQPDVAHLDHLQLWTFSDAREGPAAVEIAGQTFTCHGFEIATTAPQMRDSLLRRAVEYDPDGLDVTVTIKFRCPQSVQVRAVPTSVPIR